MNRGDQMYFERYAYCVCVPVKPATLFYGSINFISYALYSILIISSFGINDGTDMYDYRHYNRQTTSLSVTIYLFHTTVSILLIYGVIKSKASYLMPFFGVQLFEFFFTLPMFLQSLYTTTHYHWDESRVDHENAWPPFRNPPTQTSLILNSSNYKLLSPFFRLSHLCIQGFFLCVIWKCYRYLKLRELMIPINFPSTVESSLGQNLVSSSVSMPPPDYESVTKSSPPPDYESAIRSIIQQTDPKTDDNLQTAASEDVTVKIEDNCPIVNSINETVPLVNAALVENNCEQPTNIQNEQEQQQRQQATQQQQDQEKN